MKLRFKILTGITTLVAIMALVQSALAEWYPATGQGGP